MQFGIKGTYPHLFGVVIGTGLLAAISSLGVNHNLAGANIKSILKVISISWITYLALQLLIKDYMKMERVNLGHLNFLKRYCFNLSIRNFGLLLFRISWIQFDGSIFFKTLFYFLLFASVNFIFALLASIWKSSFQILEKENNQGCFMSNGYIFNVRRIFDFDTIANKLNT